MPAFAATAVDALGRRHTFMDEAPDAAQFRAALRARNFWPVRVEPVRPSRRFARQTLPTRDFIALLDQL